MELRFLSTFIQVVEQNSFSKAAETLGYAQSTVSFHINQLEEELHCRLFDRTGHEISLTSRGEDLLRYALSINNSMEQLKEEFSKEESLLGTVRICSADSICQQMMLRNYAKFHKTYPDIKLIFSTGSTTDLISVLERNEADVIFTLDRHVYRKNFIIAKESPVKMHFVTKPGGRLAKKKALSIKDIISSPVMLTERGTSYRQILDDELSALSLEVNPVLETARTDIITKILKDIDGVSFLPEFSVKEGIDSGRLFKLNVKDFDITIWKQLIYRKDKWLSGVMQAFIDFVIENEFDW